MHEGDGVMGLGDPKIAESAVRVVGVGRVLDREVGLLDATKAAMRSG